MDKDSHTLVISSSIVQGVSMTILLCLKQLNLHCPDDDWCQIYCSLLGHFYFLLDKYLSKTFKMSCFFLLLRYKNSLFIMHTRPMLSIEIANSLSYSRICPLNVLMMLFAIYRSLCIGLMVFAASWCFGTISNNLLPNWRSWNFLLCFF